MLLLLLWTHTTSHFLYMVSFTKMCFLSIWFWFCTVCSLMLHVFVCCCALQENPLFVHTFSNGGCRVYRHLSDLVHNSKQFASLTLHGIIFDSAPSKLKIFRGIRVYMSLASYSFFVKYFVATCMFLWLVFVHVLSRCMPFVRILDDSFWAFLCEDPAICPQLYLYSVQDAVIPYSDIEELIAVRRSRGVQVLTQRWDDSAHVSHLIAHRESYIMACLDFLQRCLHVNNLSML